MAKVTVIIPAYNQAAYLGIAIQSVLNQSWSDFEAVVVDDGSSDNTQEVVARFPDERIRCIHQANQGLPGARNTGIRFSDSEYVALLDADDEFLPHKLSAQIALLEANPSVGLVAAGFIFINETGAVIREERPWLDAPDLRLRSWLLGQPFVPAAILIRRDWLESVGLFDEQLRAADEDWDLYLRLAHAGCEMSWLREPMCRYRIHRYNVTRNPSAMKTGGLAVLNKFYGQDNLPAEVADLKNYAFARVHVDAAVRAYSAGLNEQGREDLLRAVTLAPDLLEGRPPKILEMLMAWALTPYVSDKGGYVHAVMTNLPAEVSDLGWTQSRTLALLQMMTGMDNYRYSRGDVVRPVIQALLRDPGWLHNRGVCAMLVKEVQRWMWEKVLK